jgi:hypothetical protein
MTLWITVFRLLAKLQSQRWAADGIGPQVRGLGVLRQLAASPIVVDGSVAGFDQCK